MNLVTLIGPHLNPKTSSPNYNPDARCEYHPNSPGHDTDDCWRLEYKCQNAICLWIVPELLLEDDLNKYQDDIRLWIVPELFLGDNLD